MKLLPLSITVIQALFTPIYLDIHLVDDQVVVRAESWVKRFQFHFSQD